MQLQVKMSITTKYSFIIFFLYGPKSYSEIKCKKYVLSKQFWSIDGDNHKAIEEIDTTISKSWRHNINKESTKNLQPISDDKLNFRHILNAAVKM